MNMFGFHRFLRAVLWRFQRIITKVQNFMQFTSAGKLNNNLFADVNRLEKADIELIKLKFREFSKLRGYDEDAQQKWETHIYRILLSEEWINEVVGTLPSTNMVLDLGTENVISDYWRFKLPQLNWTNTSFDLRYAWNLPPESSHLIICTETVEHLADPPNPSFNEGFYQYGMTALLQESFKVLKPGGYLFLTTPNAASVIHLKAVLQGAPPWFFINHVREYTAEEIIGHVTKAGFEIVKHRDVHCMSVTAYSDYAPIYQLLLDYGFPVTGRADDLFFLLRKPQSV